MKLDWNRRERIGDQNITLHAKGSDRPPRVTVGVPTFNRTDTLRRTLRALARQSFRDFVVIVSDNAGDDPATVDAVRAAAAELPEVILIAQPRNLGALPNMNLLLACAQTEYFMWLADDDEVSETYLEELVALLDARPEAVAAMGNWRMMTAPQKGALRPQLDNSAPGTARRVWRYIAGPADDSFFYGLHRTERIRSCRFGDYLFPNAGVLTNWCYVFLFDLILQGPVLHSDRAEWICHNYSVKQYTAAASRGLGDRAKTLLRRINVYALYNAKVVRHRPLLLLVSLPASVAGLARDVLSFSGRLARRRLGRRAPV